MKTKNTLIGTYITLASLCASATEIIIEQATTNDYVFENTDIVYSNPEQSLSDKVTGIHSYNYIYTHDIGSEDNRISVSLEGNSPLGVWIGCSDYAEDRIAQNVYLGTVSVKNYYVKDNTQAWFHGMQVRGMNFKTISIENLLVSCGNEGIPTSYATSVGFRNTNSYSYIETLEIKDSLIESGRYTGVIGVLQSANGVSATIGTLKGNINVVSYFEGFEYATESNRNQRARGISNYYVSGQTGSINIESMQAKISVVAEKSDAYGIYMDYGLDGAMPFRLNLAKSGEISAKGADASHSHAIYINGSSLEINGDENVQKLKGNIFASGRIDVFKGNYSIGSNFAEGMKWETNYENIQFNEGATVMFESSTEFANSTVTFGSGSKAVLYADSTDNFTSIATSDTYTSVTFDQDSAITLVLNDGFSANEGDSFSILDSESIINFYGAFSVEDFNGQLIGEDLYSFEDGTITFLGNIVIPEPSTFASIMGIFAIVLLAFKKYSK